MRQMLTCRIQFSSPGDSTISTAASRATAREADGAPAHHGTPVTQDSVTRRSTHEHDDSDRCSLAVTRAAPAVPRCSANHLDPRCPGPHDSATIGSDDHCVLLRKPVCCICFIGRSCVSCWTVLYCAALYCAVLYCTVPRIGYIWRVGRCMAHGGSRMDASSADGFCWPGASCRALCCVVYFVPASPRRHGRQ